MVLCRCHCCRCCRSCSCGRKVVLTTCGFMLLSLLQVLSSLLSLWPQSGVNRMWFYFVVIVAGVVVVVVVVVAKLC